MQRRCQEASDPGSPSLSALPPKVLQELPIRSARPRLASVLCTSPPSLLTQPLYEREVIPLLSPQAINTALAQLCYRQTTVTAHLLQSLGLQVRAGGIPEGQLVLLAC